jgi:DNA-binding CsgD family transcriptional regulator
MVAARAPDASPVSSGRQPLVGRAAELGRVAGWVEDLVARSGRAALIEGEPGIGKSALLHAAAEQAQASGCAVFWGAGEKLPQEFPLLPLLQAFDIRASSPDPLRADVLRAVRGSDSPAGAVEAVIDLIDQICAQSPAVLIIDDLHWADAATVSVCRRLSGSVIQRPLLLVAAMRALPRRDDLKAVRRAVHRDSVVRLAPLGAEAATQLVAGLAGGAPGPTLARLAAGASGNPLYLTELVHALDRGGALTVAGGTADVTTEVVPRTLTEAINDRLDFLGGDTRQVLQAATLLFGEFTVDDLAIAAGRRPAELGPALTDASAAGVLVETGARLRFRHPLVRSALYDALPTTLRTAWHRNAAGALHDAGAAPELVARQLLPTLKDSGQRLGSPLDAWVVDWLVTSSAVLLNQAPLVAVELLAAAVQDVPSHDPRRLALTSRLANGLIDVGRVEEATQLLERTVPLVDDPALSTALRSALARCRLIAGQLQTGLDELERALANPGLSTAQRARLLSYAARCHHNLGRINAAEQAAHEALAAAGADGDPEVRAHVFLTLAAVRAWSGEEFSALEMTDLAGAEASRDPGLIDLQLTAQDFIGAQLAALDRVDDAESTLRAVVRLAERVGNESVGAGAQVWLACLHYDTGRWEDARSAAVLAAAAPEVYRHAHLDGVLALIALHRGQAAAARRHLSKADAYLNSPGRAVLGNLWLARALDRELSGDPAAALAILQVPLIDLQQLEAYLADAVRLAVLVGDRGAAEQLAAQATALPLRDKVPRRAALAAHCRGLQAADPAALLQAAGLYEQARRPLPRAHALEAAARLLAEGGDIAAARGPFATSQEVYAALGAGWDITRARAQFRPFGMRPPVRRRRRPTAGWEALTRAEADVAGLVAAGLSNPEIAQRLMVSRHTVESHVARALAKVGVRSRVELARVAATHEQPSDH